MSQGGDKKGVSRYPADKNGAIPAFYLYHYFYNASILRAVFLKSSTNVWQQSSVYVCGGLLPPPAGIEAMPSVFSFHSDKTRAWLLIQALLPSIHRSWQSRHKKKNMTLFPLQSWESGKPTDAAMPPCKGCLRPTQNNVSNIVDNRPTVKSNKGDLNCDKQICFTISVWWGN